MSATIYVTDAHPLLWYLAGNERITARAAAAIERLDALLVVPAIVLAEIASCHARGRTPVSLANALVFVDDSDNCVVRPIDREIVELMPPFHDIHDGLIVATALWYQQVLGSEVALITADRDITDSKLIPTLW